MTRRKVTKTQGLENTYIYNLGKQILLTTLTYPCSLNKSNLYRVG